VKVVQHEHQGLGRGGVFKEGGDGVEEAEPGLLRLQGGRRVQVGQFLTHFRNDFRDVGGAGSHLSLQSLGVTTLDVRPDGLDPGPVGRCSFVLVKPAP
jgi:hypothetical protein